MTDLNTMLNNQEIVTTFETKLRTIPKYSLTDSEYETLLDELLSFEDILSVEQRTSLNMNVMKKSANETVKKSALLWMKYLQQID